MSPTGFACLDLGLLFVIARPSSHILHIYKKDKLSIGVQHSLFNKKLMSPFCFILVIVECSVAEGVEMISENHNYLKLVKKILAGDFTQSQENCNAFSLLTTNST